MELNELQFQQLDLNGLKTLISWAEAEGWNPGPFDADVFFATDPEGFYGYYHDGKLIAGGSVVSYNGRFGFMGLFIVKPEHRSAGIGKQLWHQRRDTLLARLNEGTTIGMDGVVAMQPFYNRGGFEIAFRDERYVRTGAAFEVHKNISPIVEEDLDAILGYDADCFGFPRPQFMQPWLFLPGNKTFKYAEGKMLQGFAVVRKLMSGYKIGPLFADNATIAEELYKACLNAVQGQQVYIDIPVCNAAAVEMVSKYKAEYVFECARMYYGTPPKVDMNKVFGITSFELG